MLSLALEMSDAAGRWRFGNDAWRCGASWVEPFAHPVLETLAATDGRRTAIVVRERLAGAARTVPEAVCLDSAALDDWVTAARRWPLEYAMAEMTAGRCVLSAGVWGTAPLYLRATDGVLRGSWHLPDLLTGLGHDDLAGPGVVAYLARRHRYGARTLFSPITRLTERASAVWTGGELRLSLPPPAPQAAARSLRAGVDPVAMYGQILMAAVRRYLPGERFTVELSGGLDSATVGLTAARVLDGVVPSYGLLLPGSAGVQQVRRRRELLRLGGFRDVTVPAVRWLPFIPGRYRARTRHDPEEEPYGEALSAILATVAATEGTGVVLTGIGGDELMALRADEADTARVEAAVPVWLSATAREQLWALDGEEFPATVLPEPSLLAAGCRAPVFLRHGFWPASPLCTPELVRFCQWLPARWRRGRELQRAWLRRTGLTEDWLRPRLRENFAEVMRRGLGEHGLPWLRTVIDNSVLVDLGYVDGDAARSALQAAGADRDDRWYELVNLEWALRSPLG